MAMNTLSQFTKPFRSWVATCSMSLIYILDGEVSEGMLLTCTVPPLGLKMWQNPGGQAIFQECWLLVVTQSSWENQNSLKFCPFMSAQTKVISSVLQTIVWRICLLKSINWIFSSFSKYWWCYNLNLNMQWDTQNPSERTASLHCEKVLIQNETCTILNNHVPL